MTPESRATHVSPLTWFPRLAVKGSAKTPALTILPLVSSIANHTVSLCTFVALVAPVTCLSCSAQITSLSIEARLAHFSFSAIKTRVTRRSGRAFLSRWARGTHGHVAVERTHGRTRPLHRVGEGGHLFQHHLFADLDHMLSREGRARGARWAPETI